ncbi:prepilin-type N-terminal cleavage/methylation domain-containing protein [Lysinibacillus xylanilyticus]|uniref:Prepilin-type N-terminal cleavage/methylation domain-containing protein n=1 Tax=Lysinibacillus xylanilyticus TaxID=582475 RepID=A0ABT4EJ22_9BACI|nr:prepilin-type N-terminal cleavage/methylation domain-containing protein [Lysinibacillus xylanilyticus]MCY9545645.1 prepilin-type N-terminal cleavage/methylation domain-containing protein [Lysinibacillus xylanilyticus]
MFKKIMNKKLLKNQKGLTLIELLAVIVILAIVAAIAIPAIGNIIDNSKLNGVKADAINVLNAANLYYTDNPDANDDVKVSELITAKYLDAGGKITKDTTSRVSKEVPRRLTATVTKAVKSFDVKFNGVTIDDINGDTKKGSDLKEALEINPK